METNAGKIKETFAAAVKSRLEASPNEWNAADSAAVVLALVKSITDETGTGIALTPHEEDVIELASHPTIDVQMRVVENIIANHKGTPDKHALRQIRRVVNAASFKLELTKSGYIKE